MEHQPASQDSEFETMGLRGFHGRPYVMASFHRHGEVEINFIKQGSVTYVSGSRQATIPAGQLALFWAAIPHRLVSHDEPTTFYWLTLPLTSFLQWHLPDSLVSAVLNGDVVINQDVAQFDRDKLLIHQWYVDLEAGSGERCEVVLLELQARLKRLALSTEVNVNGTRNPAVKPLRDDVDLGNVERMVRFIAIHYPEPVRVADVAGDVGLNPNYAMTLFRRGVGMGIVEFLTWHRIMHAQRLLATTSVPVLDIAFASGFGSASRFYAAFKRECGVTPREYRASLQR
jgi:AraC-like DNA-binding protein